MKVVFSDLDETLLVDWRVPEINLRAIRKIREVGNLFVPCSGRPPFMMDEILKELGLYGKKGSYYVCYNGGMIFEADHKEPLISTGLTFEEALIPVRLAQKANLCAMVFTSGDLHLFNPDPSEVERKKRQKVKVILHDGYDISILKEEKIAKVMMIKDRGQEYLKALSKTFPAEIFEQFAVTFSSGRFMEFNAKNVSKGNAVRFLSKHLGVPIEETIAVGDNFNDMEMLKAAGLGACVSSAPDEVKANSDYVCERDYMDGAVAEVLEKFVL